MMIRRWSLIRVLSLACMAAVVSASWGDDKGAATAPATAPAPAAEKAPDTIKLFLMDGSMLAGKLGTSEIEVKTKYGVLKVPLSDIRSFTPGLASHTEFNERLQQLISDLGADGFAEREKATETLRKMGPEIRGELDKALKTAETEKQARLTKLIEEIDQAKQGMGDEDASGETWQRNDSIVTPDFTIAGQIMTREFAVNSNYGALNVKLGDIKAVRRESTAPEELRRNVTVAGALIPQHGFENTGIRVAKGDVVQLTATGSIMMQPWGNQSSGPDGGANFGQMQPGNFPGGALIAKLNQNGPLFKVGSKHTFTADRAGILMFGVAMPGEYQGYQFPGEYSVKVKVVKKAP